MGSLRDRFGDFEKLDRYPGSNRPIPERPEPAETVAEEKERKPLRYFVAGQQVEFFTIGDLARSLGRSAVTLRRWEAQGILPKAKYRTPGPVRQKARRLYTREQFEAIVRIAGEEGLLARRPPPIGETKFTARILPYFKLEKNQ